MDKCVYMCVNLAMRLNKVNLCIFKCTKYVCHNYTLIYYYNFLEFAVHILYMYYVQVYTWCGGILGGEANVCVWRQCEEDIGTEEPHSTYVCHNF